MNDNNALLSKTIQETRKFLYQEGFFENHLYSLSGKVSGTDPISTDKGVLRVTPEPDVWIVPREVDRFFYLGSLFRSEEIDYLHSYEFTTTDLYIRGAQAETLIELFWKLLRALEKSALISDIYNIQVSDVSYESFSTDIIVSLDDVERWVLVTHYPIEESFYDAILDQNATQKSELFYLKPGSLPIEVASLGRVGKNLNPSITLDTPPPDLDIYINEELFGFCFGIERLLLVSQIHQGVSNG